MSEIANWTPPAGFERHFRRSGLTDPWEPLFSLRCEDSVRIGLLAGAAHANSRGFVHGGLITALADNAMGLSCGAAVRDGGWGGDPSLVTVSLMVDFMGTGRLGQWIEIRPRVLKAGSTLCFAEAEVLADEALCARANATFRVVPRPPQRRDVE
ncbi:PaaI family thioesterase [Chelatococcus reniformis]|uniref:Thioesterase n=1 Tax=Chelatococcus reniformis TaxID=1494448 RepID=A0A916UQ73_9HYPH|nr:PaaI family thioesterase [Chelatococcus reniformis]GGC79742.1 thioesterase [Chelatococcus reniformis]